MVVGIKLSKPIKDLRETTIYMHDGCSILDCREEITNDIELLTELGHDVIRMHDHKELDRRFDIVLCIDVLKFISSLSSRIKVLERIWSHVDSGGCMLVTTENRITEDNLIVTCQGLIHMKYIETGGPERNYSYIRVIKS